jgi:hypothetical protein
MIDRILSNFFGWIDSLFEKLDEVLTFDFPNSNNKKKEKEMRDTKSLESFLKKIETQAKEKTIFRHLKKEVEHGANGTRDYVIKKGINKGKIAK